MGSSVIELVNAKALYRRQRHRIAGHVAALGHPDANVAHRAEACLIRYYGPTATSMLIVACADPNPNVRFRAVWILGKTKDPNAFETILKLAADLDARVRYDAAVALGVLGDSRALEHLVRLALTSDPETGGDSAAASGLAHLGSISIAHLTKRLAECSESERCQLAQLLELIKDGALENRAATSAEETSLAGFSQCFSLNNM